MTFTTEDRITSNRQANTIATEGEGTATLIKIDVKTSYRRSCHGYVILHCTAAKILLAKQTLQIPMLTSRSLPTQFGVILSFWHAWRKYRISPSTQE